MTMINMIFFVTIYPVLFICYYIYTKSAGDGSGGYCYGVSIQKEWLEDEEIQKICSVYRKRIKRIAIVLALLPLLLWLVPYISINITLWLVWVFAVIGFLAMPYIQANHEIRYVKSKRGWNLLKVEGTVAEMKSAGNVRCIGHRAFLLPLLISGIMMVWGIWDILMHEYMAEGVAVAAISLCTGLLYGCGVWMDRFRTSVVSTDSDININYTRAKKMNWKRFWLYACWCNAVYTAAAGVDLRLEVYEGNFLVLETIIYSTVLLILMVLTWRRQKRIETSYESYMDLQIEEDDDKNWIGGMLYYNKKDRRIMVNQRNGLGTTVNMATPVGIGFEIFGVAVLLMISVMCIWLIQLEFTPIHLYVEDHQIYAKQLKEEYIIPISEIENVTVTEELPRWSKSVGTAMENLEIGTFHIRNVGKCEVFLNPQNERFIIVETDEKTYYLGGVDDEETKQVYEQLTKE